MRQAQRTGWRSMITAACVTAALLLTSGVYAQDSNATLVRETLAALNALDTVKGAETVKAYKKIFDAYLEMSKPPMEVGSAFNLNTIHPKMKDWKAVSGWAESNP